MSDPERPAISFPPGLADGIRTNPEAASKIVLVFEDMGRAIAEMPERLRPGIEAIGKVIASMRRDTPSV
jgi:hypothetical protein